MMTQGPDDLFEEDLGGGSAPNPLMMIHRSLRGRYHWAILLGLALAIPCAAAGYFALKPVYTSQAVLEANATDPILYETLQNSQGSAFDAFIRQQATTLQSERVLNHALSDPDLLSTGWPRGTSGMIKLRNSLEIDTPSRANQIFVKVSDTDRLAAQAAARALLDAYNRIREENERNQFTFRENQLITLRDEYLRDRNEKRKNALDRKLSVAGTEDIDDFQKSKLNELGRIDEQIRELTVMLSYSENPGFADEMGVLPDSKLERLTDELELLNRQLDSLLLSVTPQHRQAKQLMREIRVLETEIDARRDQIASESGADDSETSEPAPPQNATRLQARIADLQRLKQQTEDMLQRIGRVQLEVLALEQEAEVADTRFQDASVRLESLRVEKESQILGRVRVAQEPERPLAPSTDRRIPLAGAGFVGGFGMGVAAIAAYGIVFPRVRVADDVLATQHDFSMLGMIPEFPDSESNGAGLNVRESFHFLRVIIDARSGPNGLVCGITSPTSGDGKTTIALRLARSFAASRRKVLLIDADLVGRGATRSLNIQPRQSMDAEHATLDDMVVHLDDMGFDVIPASDSESASEIFCGHVLRDILAAARQRYSIVLVDTGPILGSIEAAAATPVMDQILLVISRGMESRLLRMATDRLRELKARSVGIVFNRATTVDFNRSFAPPSSTSRRSTVRGLTGTTPGDARRTMMEGPDGEEE